MFKAVGQVSNNDTVSQLHITAFWAVIFNS